MKAKTGIRILFYSCAMAILLHHYWDRICFGICFAKGDLDAEFNLRAHRKIIFTFGSPFRMDFPRWNGEQWDDTAWVVDSLIFSKYGFKPKQCDTIPESERRWGYLDLIGPFCTTPSRYYGSGYQSVYNPYVIREFVPRATAEAKAILAARSPNWKDALPDEQRKARILFFKP